MMVCKHFVTFFTWHTKAPEHGVGPAPIQHNQLMANILQTAVYGAEA